MNRRGFLLGAVASSVIAPTPELVGAEKLFGPHIQAAILKAREAHGMVLIPHRIYAFTNQDFFVYNGSTVEKIA